MKTNIGLFLGFSALDAVVMTGLWLFIHDPWCLVAYGAASTLLLNWKKAQA